MNFLDKYQQSGKFQKCGKYKLTDNLFQLNCTSYKFNQNLQMIGGEQKKGRFGQSTGAGNEQKMNAQDNVNTTANNSLRYSNLVSHSHQNSNLASTGIHCPVYNEQGVYKCEICSNLRVVCPRNRASKQRGVINIQSAQGMNKQSMNSNYINRQDVIRINAKQNESVRGGGGFIYNSNADRISAGFSNHLPRNGTNGHYVRPASSGPAHTYVNGLNGVEGGYNQGMHRKPGTPVTPGFLPPGNSYSSMHSQHSVRPNIRYIQEVVYMPVFHNIIKPQFVNPQAKFQHSTNIKFQEGTPEQNRTKLSEPQTSPIRVEQYDDRVIMKPSNLRHLANSIIR